MRVCILSGRYPATSFDSSINHRLYADTYGYHYIHCNWPTLAKNPYNNKIYYLLKYIDLFDYIFWIDDDAFFFDFGVDISDYLPLGDQVLTACKSPCFKELKTYLSSGQFFIKCDTKGKKFLEDVLATDLAVVKKWWIEDLGFFTNGDQDSMVYQLLTNTKYQNSYKLFDYKSFNSRPENILERVDAHEPFILHFTGKPEIKEKNYVLIQNVSGRKSHLVKPEISSKYKIFNTRKKSMLDRVLTRLRRLV